MIIHFVSVSLDVSTSNWKKESSFLMKLIYFLVGTLISEIAVFEVEANVLITNDYFVEIDAV